MRLNGLELLSLSPLLAAAATVTATATATGRGHGDGGRAPPFVLHRRNRGGRRRSLEDAPDRYPFQPYARRYGASSSEALSSASDLAAHSVRWGRCASVAVGGVGSDEEATPEGVDPEEEAAVDDACVPCAECRGWMNEKCEEVGEQDEGLYMECLLAYEIRACEDVRECDIEACHALGLRHKDQHASPSSSGPAKFFAEISFCATGTGSSDAAADAEWGCDECAGICERAAYAEEELQSGSSGNENSYDYFEEMIMMCSDCVTDNCPGGGGGGGYPEPSPSSFSQRCHRRIMPLYDYLSVRVRDLTGRQQMMCETCEEECQTSGRTLEDERPSCFVCPEQCETEFLAEEGAEELREACERCEMVDRCEGGVQPGNDGAGSSPARSEPDCDSCYDECMKIENMEENGYIDATEFLSCQMVYDYDPNDKINGADPLHDGPLYAGPVCAASGAKVKVGIFLDEYCTRLDPTKEVDDYLVDGDGYMMKLSHALLKMTYSMNAPLSCLDDENDESSAPQPTSTCSILRDTSAPKPEYVLSLVTEEGRDDVPPFVRANIEVEVVGSDGKPTLADNEESTELLLRSVWSTEESGRQRQTKMQRRRRVDEDEMENLEGEFDEMEEYYEGEAEAEEYFEDEEEAEAEWDEEWYDEDEANDAYADAEVRFAFLPLDSASPVGWRLHSTFLAEERREEPAPWIYNSVGPMSEIGGDVDEGEDILLHCETVEFTYIEAVADDGDGSGAEGDNIVGIVRLRDVIMGPHDEDGRPTVCGRTIRNPCDDAGGTEAGDMICHMVDARVSCLAPSETGAPSPVPGLSRREYLESYLCSEEDAGEGNSGDAYWPPIGDDHENEENENEGENGNEISFWDQYALRPMKCAIVDGEEMVLYSFYRNTQYSSPCEDRHWNGTQLAPVTDFLRSYLGPVDEEPKADVDCVKVDGGEVGEDWDGDAWVRVGCSDWSEQGLFVNAYTDDQCTEGRTTLEAADLQIPFQMCVLCGYPEYWRDDDDEEENYYNENANNNNNNNNNNYNGGIGSSLSAPRNLQCSDLLPDRWQSCDEKCQFALLGDAGTSRDLYWRGRHAFLQASDVAASANGTDFLFEDDLGRVEYINSGREGGEISREDAWSESGQERRVKFYFFPNMAMDDPPSADRANELGWNLHEARMYSYNGAYSDWVYWENKDGESDIRVPPGKQLFFCDYVEFNFASNLSESAGKFVGHNVYLGAYLPGYPQFEVCSLEVHDPCENDDGTRSLCRAIDGAVSCVDFDVESNSTVPAASARSSPPAHDLFCTKPGRVPTPEPASLEWKGASSYLHASAATASYQDGTPLDFDDRLGRAEAIESGEVGELLARQTDWADTSSGMERRLALSFSPRSPSASGDILDDVATWGWMMNPTLMGENHFYEPGWLSSPNAMIQVPAGKLAPVMLFHCEYMEFNFKPDYRFYEEESDGVFWDPSRHNGAASFAAYDVVIGAYLPDDYDICSLEAYNPCAESGRLCHAINGRVSCEESLKQNPSVMTARASIGAEGLPMCGDSAFSVGANESTIPAAEPTTSPIALANTTAAPAPSDDYIGETFADASRTAASGTFSWKALQLSFLFLMLF